MFREIAKRSLNVRIRRRRGTSIAGRLKMLGSNFLVCTSVALATLRSCVAGIYMSFEQTGEFGWIRRWQ
jgi:hypothetical protein